MLSLAKMVKYLKTWNILDYFCNTRKRKIFEISELCVKKNFPFLIKTFIVQTISNSKNGLKDFLWMQKIVQTFNSVRKCKLCGSELQYLSPTKRMHFSLKTYCSMKVIPTLHLLDDKSIKSLKSKVSVCLLLLIRFLNRFGLLHTKLSVTEFFFIGGINSTGI